MRSTVVTGASGFLGRHVVSALLAAGRAVVALVRDEPTVALLPEHPALRIVRAELDTSGSVDAALEGVDVRAVIHLAGGRAPGGLESIDANVRLSLAPTAALIAALSRRAELEAFVLASSGEVYGAVPAPFRESAEASPRSGYGIAKLLAEELSLAAFRARGFPAVVVRMGVVYGPGQLDSPMFVPALLEAARQRRPFEMSQGEQLRDFVYVRDVATTLVQLSSTPAARGEIVNVGTGEGVQVRELASRLWERLGRPMELRIGALPMRPDEASDYRLDVTKLRALTGSAPSTPLDEGLDLTARELEATPTRRS